MKITIDTKAFQEAVRIAGRGVSKTSQSVLLEGIVFDAADGKLTLNATDLRLSICTVADCKVDEPGRWVMSAAMIGEVSRKFQGDTITLTTEPEGKTTIQSGRAKVEFQAMEATDFPAFPEFERGEPLRIQGGVLQELVRRTRIAVSQDEHRQIYTGIKFFIRPGEIEAVALDGFRVAILKLPVDTAVEDAFVTPLSALSEVAGLVGEETALEIYRSASHAVFSFGDTLLYTRLLEGEFLDYRPLIRDKGKTEMVVSGKELIAALERTNIISKGTLNMVKFDIRDDHMEIQSVGNLGSTDDAVDVVKEGEDLTIAFNARYLIEGMRVMQEGKFRFVFEDHLQPLNIESIQDGHMRYIVLPVRIS